MATGHPLDNPNLRGAVVAELYTALETLGAHPYLLAIVNSWGDGQNDAETLKALEDWNAGTFKVDLIASSGKIPPP
jgi:hypothetical protein